MNNRLLIITTIMFFSIASFLIYTIVNQQQQIVKIEQQLQHEQLKYKMLYRDPVVRDVIESGG